MSKTIHELHLNNMALYINDRMSTNDSKNRILFEIALLSEQNVKIKAVEYFMNIPDAKYLCHLVLSNQFKKQFHRVKGTQGNARAMTVSYIESDKKPGAYYYQIKIDNGKGKERENGFTQLEKKDSGLYFKLTEEDMTICSLLIRDRIFVNEINFYKNEVKSL